MSNATQLSLFEAVFSLEWSWGCDSFLQNDLIKPGLVNNYGGSSSKVPEPRSGNEYFPPQTEKLTLRAVIFFGQRIHFWGQNKE